MDCRETGALIARFRKEKGYTQLALASRLGVSDRAVSKWERGAGFPDVDTLAALSEALGTDVNTLLKGQMTENTALNGNMKKCRIYYCPICGNVIVALGDADVACCGRKMSKLTAQKAEGAHFLNATQVEDEWYITSSHPMEKGHYISAVFALSGDKLQMTKLYPEGGVDLRFKKCGASELYLLCNKHGLFKQTLR